MAELGIAKDPSKSYTNDDIENVVSAYWNGEGRLAQPASPGKTRGGNDTGCGCGCGGSC